MGEAFRYAWYGSGPKWGAAPMQLMGGLLGGLLFPLLDLKLPQQIIDNPLWSNGAAVIIGGMAGVTFAFLLRLAYWPIHRRVAPLGGLLPALRAKLGVQMGPVILMASGMLAFVVLFGGGAIWAVVQSTEWKRQSVPGTEKVYVPYDIEQRLKAIDLMRGLLESLRLMHHAGVDLHTSINSALEQGRAPSADVPHALRDYATKVETVLNQLQENANRYREYRYITDVVSFTPADNPFEVVASARSLAKNLNDMPKDASTAFYSSLISNQNFISFGRSTHDIATLINKNEVALGEARKEVLALPIVPTR